jgi:uncharacterized membrane protein
MGLLGLLLIVVFALLEIGVIEAAYYKLGMSHRTITVLLMLTIMGSYLNLPIGTIGSGNLMHNTVVIANGVAYVVPGVRQVDHTVIAVNVGGALIPVLVAGYLLVRVGGLLASLPATAIVTGVVYHFSQLVPGVGIAVPMLIPGILAAGLALLFDRRHSACVAYVAGTLGCLIGADILNLGAVATLGAPVVSIGGAGTFDGVFVSGIIAVLLA